jgi:uncharacterized protein
MAGKFEIKKSGNGQFMFNLKAGNHEVILTSDLYHEKQSVRNAVESVRANALDDGRYERKTAKNGSPSFRAEGGERRSDREERDVFLSARHGERYRVSLGRMP